MAEYDFAHLEFLAQRIAHGVFRMHGIPLAPDANHSVSVEDCVHDLAVAAVLPDIVSEQAASEDEGSREPGDEPIEHLIIVPPLV